MVHSWIYGNHFLSIFGEMCFLNAGPVVCIPMMITEFFLEKELRVFLQEASSSRINPILWHVPWLLLLFAPLPLAVITVVGLHDVLMVSNSAELRSFQLTICILAPESTTNSLSSCSGEYPFLRGKVECSLVFFLELFLKFLARFQALLRAHRCSRSASSRDLSSNFIA